MKLFFRSGLKKSLKTDSGVASENASRYVDHPTKGMKVVWFGPRLPGPPPEVGPAFGNAVFNLPVDFLESLLKKGYHCYWVECLRFKSIVAVRLDNKSYL